jgi:glutathione S-transferase
MPRPEVAVIGTKYRRIPIMAIGRDIYNDTRLIIHKLEELFPSANQISATDADQKAIERLLESWAIDSGLFTKAAALMPSDLPIFKDPKFTKDREDFTGRDWSKGNIDRGRPEALVEIRSAFEFLETTLLADGRDWILKTERPTLADIEGMVPSGFVVTMLIFRLAVWLFHWTNGLKGCLPPALISAKQFPKVFAWIDRFDKATKVAAQEAGKPKTLNGPQAEKQISNDQFAESEGDVDGNDPSGARKGDIIEVWPIDSGSSRKDVGKLVALSSHEIVVESKTESGQLVRVHTPRHGFRFRKVDGAKL